MLNSQIKDSGPGTILADIFRHVVAFRKILGPQEPGSDEQIAEFCRINHGVTFPLMSKIDVNGNKLFYHKYSVWVILSRWEVTI